MNMKPADSTENKMLEISEPAEGLGRKSFLKLLGAAAVTGWIGYAFGSEKKKAPQGEWEKVGDGKKRKWGMAIDLDLCSGCGSCVVACHVENNVPFTGDDPKKDGTEINWMTLLPLRQEGEGQLTPLPCMHCENPPCVKVCPVNATFQTEEGIVDQIWDRCIGCRYCENACPYSRRYFNWAEPEWPETYKQALNPDVATRPGGVVEKCTFCVHRIRDLKEKVRAEDREITDDDVRLLPACAQSCPAEAIIFGDLNDEDSLVSRLSDSPRANRLLEHVGTKPKVFYLAKEKPIGLDRKES